MRKELPVRDITDPAALECVESLVDELAEQVLGRFRGRFITVTLGPGSHQWPHRLGFVPKDVIETSVRGGGFTWNFADFTKTHISVTVAGSEATVRAFIGRYLEE